MEEKKQNKKRKKQRKKSYSFFLLQGLFIIALVMVVILFVKSDYAGGIFKLRSEAIEAVDNSTREDMQGLRVGTVYDADGNVDMDASRRVSFRFIVALGE